MPRTCPDALEEGNEINSHHSRQYNYDQGGVASDKGEKVVEMAVLWPQVCCDHGGERRGVPPGQRWEEGLGPHLQSWLSLSCL